MLSINETIKWAATAVLIAGTAVNGLGVYPLGPIMLIVGGLMWLVVALRIRDWPLIVTNTVMSLVALATVVYTLLTKGGQLCP